MKTRLTVLCIGALIGLCAAGPVAAANLTVDNPSGGMRIQLSVPIVSDVDHTSPITGGHIEIAEGPAIGSLGKHFVLTKVSLQFADFRIDRSPFADKTMRQVGVHLRDAVPFAALQIQPGVYQIFILANEITFFGGAVVNGDVESGDERPSEAVTGTIDLNTGTIEARVVVPKHQDVDWCFPVGCSIDGSLTITLTGTIGPDADGDGVRDAADNCRLVANPAQQPVASPVITAPPDVAFLSCAPRGFGRATAADVCDALPVTLTHDAPPRFEVGTNVVTWTGQTASGRTATATQRVTVIDKTRPTFVFVPPAITVTACGPVDLGLATAVDDCGFGPPQVTHDAPASFGPGTTVVTWTATDAAGNKTTATQTVTVNDTTPPVFTFVPPDKTLTKCVGADIGLATATDSCGVTITNNAPVKFPLAQTTVVTWTARDGAGNIATATQKIDTELGDDASCCPQGSNIKLGTSGRDVILGTAGCDCILGRGGDDVIDARGETDFVSGGQGRDVINVGFGSDLVWGREGDDVIEGGPGNDTIDGGPGIDVCAGSLGHNTIKRCEVQSGS